MTLLPDAVDAIEAYAWPGNVRELENRVKRAVIMAESCTIRAADIGLAPAPADPEAFNLRQIRDQAEKQAVIRALGRTNSNRARRRSCSA